MNLAQLRHKASLENPNIQPYIQEILDRRTIYPKGSSISIPTYVIPSLKEYCDKEDIPFFHVAENVYSTAATYSDLLAYEESR